VTGARQRRVTTRRDLGPISSEWARINGGRCSRLGWTGGSRARRAVPPRSTDSPLEGNGFEVPVPREIDSGFEGSPELWSIDRRRGGIIRAVVGIGKPIELLRCLEESSFTAA
jgi:hypothetical protein